MIARADSQIVRQLAHGLRERNIAHQLVETYRIAAFVAREAMEESALEINREAWVSFAAVCVCWDWTERLKARATRARVRTVAQIEGTIIEARLNLFAQLAQTHSELKMKSDKCKMENNERVFHLPFFIYHFSFLIRYASAPVERRD